MPLTRGRRTPDVTQVRRDGALLARRLAAGAGFLGASLALGIGVGSWAWALSALVAIPGLFTLASARRPYTAPCPACGHPLGDGLLHLPDEPVMGQDATDLRCRACGVYVDCFGAAVREVPFNRALDAPGYELSFPATELAALRWGDRCVACGDPATRALRLARFEVGVLSGFEASLDASPDGSAPPYCAKHGDASDPAGRALVVARSGGRVDVQLGLYATYRRFLDDNRDRADVSVRAMREPG